eukprot:1858936-Rhodomonas_salina.2
MSVPLAIASATWDSYNNGNGDGNGKRSDAPLEWNELCDCNRCVGSAYRRCLGGMEEVVGRHGGMVELMCETCVRGVQ